jgi:hypothetical protein
MTAIVLTKTDKWSAVSHIQKCIRRGMADEAAAMVGPLLGVDNAYLRHRLAVIAVEDIGIADSGLVCTLLEGRLLKQWIIEKGGVEWLESMVRQMALSAKDRSACDWGAIARYDVAGFEARHGDWAGLSTSAAAKMSFDNTLSLVDRGLAAWRCAGTDLFPCWALQENVAGDWAAWLEFNASMGVSSSTLESMRLGQRTQREWHPVFLGMCEYEAERQGHTIQTPSIRPSEGVGFFTSAALDVHTAEGKKAIQRWYDRSAVLQQAFEGGNPQMTRVSALESLGRLVFILEGGVVSPRFSYPTADDIQKQSRAAWARYAGLPGNATAGAVWSMLPELHSVRLGLSAAAGHEWRAQGPGQ